MDQTKWCAKAIQQIKEFLSVAPVLTMPDPKEAHNSPLVCDWNVTQKNFGHPRRNINDLQNRNVNAKND